MHGGKRLWFAGKFSEKLEKIREKKYSTRRSGGKWWNGAEALVLHHGTTLRPRERQGSGDCGWPAGGGGGG